MRDVDVALLLLPAAAAVHSIRERSGAIRVADYTVVAMMTGPAHGNPRLYMRGCITRARYDDCVLYYKSMWLCLKIGVKEEQLAPTKWDMDNHSQFELQNQN